MKPSALLQLSAISIFLMVFCFTTTAQPFQYLESNAIKGLPSAETYEIFQSRNGFIWIASDHGVVRYDGYEADIYNATKGLPDPVVFSFYEDEQNALWFRSLSGKTLFIKDGKIFQYPHSKIIEEVVKDNFFHSMVRDGSKLHFGTGSFIGAIDDDGTVIKEKIAGRKLTIRSVNDTDLIFGFMGFSTAIAEIDFDQQKYPIQLSDTLTYNKVIRAIRIKSDIFISINSDVFRISNNRCEKYFTGRGPIISLKSNKEETLWVGYLNLGADKLTLGDKKVTSTEVMFDTKSVSGILQDDEGGLWVSTLESGVYYIDNPSFHFTPLPFKPIASIFKDNQLYIGDQSGQLTQYRYPELDPVWKMNSLQPVRRLYIDRNNNLWASSDRTNVINLKNKNIIQYYGPSFTSFAEDLTHVWATGGVRYDKFDLKKNDQSSFPLPSMHSLILPIDDRVLLSKRLGLDVYSKDGQLLTSIKALEDQKISQLLIINPITVAIGTIGGGLFILNTSTLTCKNISSSNSINPSYVYCMASHDSSLYLSTEKGIVTTRLDPIINQEAESLLIGVLKIFDNEKFRFLHFTDDVILGVKDDGIVSIPFQDWNKRNSSLRFYYEVMMDGGQKSGAKELIVDFNHPLKVKFGYITYKNKNILSRYRLSRSSIWTEISNREVDLNAIASGDHILEIQSSVDSKNWTTQLTLPIQILPPWWKSWYAIAALIIFTVVLSILIVRIRLKRLEEKESLLNLIDEQRKRLIQSELETIERERTRIAKDLHDGVGTDLAAIKLSVHKIIEQSDPEMAKEINTYFQDTIKEIRFIIQDLAPPGIIEFGLRSSIQNYFDKVIAKFNMKVNFNWEGEEFTDTQRGTIIFRTIQELVTNSIKHSKGQFIDLKIVCQNNGLLIHYADDGVGFEMHNSFDGLGLRNIKSRVEFLNGKLQFASRVNRTSFEIEIPH